MPARSDEMPSKGTRFVSHTDPEIRLIIDEATVYQNGFLLTVAFDSDEPGNDEVVMIDAEEWPSFVEHFDLKEATRPATPETEENQATMRKTRRLY